MLHGGLEGNHLVAGVLERTAALVAAHMRVAVLPILAAGAGLGNRRGSLGPLHATQPSVRTPARGAPRCGVHVSAPRSRGDERPARHSGPR